MDNPLDRENAPPEEGPAISTTEAAATPANTSQLESTLDAIRETVRVSRRVARRPSQPFQY